MVETASSNTRPSCGLDPKLTISTFSEFWGPFWAWLGHTHLGSHLFGAGGQRVLHPPPPRTESPPAPVTVTSRIQVLSNYLLLHYKAKCRTWRPLLKHATIPLLMVPLAEGKRLSRGLAGKVGAQQFSRHCLNCALQMYDRATKGAVGWRHSSSLPYVSLADVLGWGVVHDTRDLWLSRC